MNREEALDIIQKQELKIQMLIKVVNDILDVVYFDNNDIIKTHQYRAIKDDIRKIENLK